MSKNGKIILIALLFLGAALTLFGLANLKHSISIGWTHSGRYNFAIFTSLCLAGVVIGSRLTRKPPRFIGTIIALGFTLIAGAWWPVIATLWFIFAAFLLGHHVQALLGITAKDDQCVLRFLTGAGVYGTLVALLAHFPINYPALYGFALLLPFLINKQVVFKYGTQFKNWLLCTEVVEEDRFNWLGALLTVIAIVYFVIALMPEMGHDALAMHLFVSAHMAHQHGWGFDATTYVWAVMPMLGDFIYSIGYVLGGETASRLINISFVFALTRLIRELVLWGGGDTSTIRWTNLIFLSTPLTFSIGSSLFVESVWSAFTIAGSFVIFRIYSGSENLKSDISLAGMLLGFAIASKAIALMFLPALFLVLLWRWKSWLNSTCFKSTVIGLFLFLAPGTIPYFTAFYKTGNPVFPFINQVFKSEFYPSVNFDSSTIFGKGLAWDFPYRVIFHTGEFLESHAGGSGFQWLLLLLPAIGFLVLNKNKRISLVLAVAAMSLLLTFQSVSYLRYVFPEWLLLTVVLGCSLFNGIVRESIFQKTVVYLGLMTLGLNLIFFNSAAFYGDFGLKPLLSDSHRKTFLKQRLPVRNAVEIVNQLNSEKSAVAIFAHPLVAGLSADALHSSWYNFHFQKLMDSAQDEETLATTLSKEGVNYVIMHSTWGTDEKRKLINKVTDPISETGDVAIRRLRDDYRFSNELLQFPEFQKLTFWTLGENVGFDDLEHYVSVSVESPAYQTIAVMPNKQYKNQVTTRCSSSAGQARMQINWLDANGKYISTDLRLIQCTDAWKTDSMKVFAPTNAHAAMVYASGHTKIPVQFKKNSLLE
ncbi:MAG: glycosyl transferase [Planctomycetes bacterium]|nr:glycosyl transferase [Planctomycetota bacterium]